MDVEGDDLEYILDRGYTMHEHLDDFSMINMNGRVYDPVIARFLSPDPFVQAPNYSQSYNRYSYVMNNPLKFTDPTGNKWWHWALGDVLTGGALSLTGITTVITTLGTAQALLPVVQSTMTALDYTHLSLENTYNHFFEKDKEKSSVKKTLNTLKIDLGMALHIPGWETEQALIGNSIAHYRNMTGHVDNVEINRGTVLVNDDYNAAPDERWGMTWGQYINSQNIMTSDNIYDHEYGHTIQSRIMGPLYTSKIAMPSGISQLYSDIIDDSGVYHENTWYEVWASQLGRANDHEKEYKKSITDVWLFNVLLPFYPN